MMFSPEHKIWQFADKWGAVEDWLPDFEQLVEKWSRLEFAQEGFIDEWQIQIAGWLLMDDLLPAPAKEAFAKLMFDAINECKENKYTVKSLHIYPPKPGNKNRKHEIISRCLDVKRALGKGKSKTEAYDEVAKKNNVSDTTIRRDYERWRKRNSERQSTGRSNNDSPAD